MKIFEAVILILSISQAFYPIQRLKALSASKAVWVIWFSSGMNDSISHWFCADAAIFKTGLKKQGLNGNCV